MASGFALGAQRRNMARRSRRFAARWRCSPTLPALRVNLAESLFALGHVSEAIREYERAAAEGDPAAREMALRNIACIAPGDPALDNAGHPARPAAVG